MAYTDNFPQRPVFMADFANGGKIDPRATFTRASTANVWDGSKHLSSENLVVQSQDLDTTWTVFTGTPAVTGGQTAPDGTSTGWLITAQTASSAISQAQQSLSSVGASTTYTLSAYLKAGTASHTYMTLRGTGSTYGFVEIDWADPLNPRVATRTFTSASATVTAVGSAGWYRVALTTTTDASSSSGVVYIGPSDGTTQNANGYPVWNSSGETALAWGVQLEQRGSVTAYNATTTQIHRQYAPSLVSKSNNVGRFDYSTDGQSVAKGILVEGAATNLLTYSNDFSQWSAFQVTAEAGAAVGPDGQSCYVMREDTSAADTHYLSLGASGQSTSTAYTMSLYAKKVASSNQTRHLRLRVNGIGGEASVEYNLSNGTVNRTHGTSLDSSSITSIGNGWYRLVMTYTNPSGSSANGMIITGSPDTSQTLPSYDGDGFTSFALFGAMVEEGSHASSLVTSNSGSQTTRAAESLSVASADIGYTGGDFTVIAEANMPGDNVGNVVEVGDGTSSNRATLQARTDGTQGMTVSNAGAVQAYIGNTSARSAKRAMRVATNNFGYCESGGTVSADTAGVVPVTSTLYVGKGYSGSELNGTLKRVALYNEALSDTNLQALTS